MLLKNITLSFLSILILAASNVFAQTNTPCGAPAITPGATCTFTAGTTVGATYANDAANGGTPTCASPGAPDVWYSFTTTVAGNYTIDGNTGTITDGGLALYSGACGSLTQVACDDDSSPDDAMGMITSALAAGTTYYLRIWSYSSGTGTFGICITSPPAAPANDNCATATVLTQGAAGTCTMTASTVLGGTSSGIANCTGTADDDVWFSFIATNSIAIINRTTTGGWDSGIEIFAGTGAAPGSCIGASLGCQDAETGFTVTGLTVGLRYFVRVYAWGAGFTPATPGFTICVTTPTITTTNISACSGNFYDSGGAGGAYGNNEVQITTICPSIAGNKAIVTFTAFATENGLDYLQIFDGNSVAAPSLGVYSGATSPGIVQATPSNASGCLTFRFISNASTTAAGWTSTISCYVPCQTITANLVSSNPVPSGGIIRVCQGQSINFVGSGTFSTSGVGATYQWSMGNGATVNGANINYTYPTAGSYLVNLLITDPSGCTNSNAFNRNVQISTTPTISTSATPATLCTNQTSALAATVTMTPYTVNCTPPVSGTTFLPDGSGVSYTTSITTNCYSPTAEVTAATDITNICLTMEHSYLGDLNIRIICPNGQSAVLKAYADGGSGTYLGSAIDDVVSGPGVGAMYCFTPGAVNLLVNGATTSTGTPASNSIVAGNYMPTQSFTNLIGCPLNGNWSIEVTDNLAQDDGYIFNWDVNFSAVVGAAASFTPTIASQGWVAAPTLTNVNATSANVTPTNQGTPCFVYSVTDNFGCTYTGNQCITVNCGLSLPVGLVSFDASAFSNERVKLDWITSSETNSDYYTIERSTDGENWEFVSEVNAAGNSTEELTYSTFDEAPYPGTSYYRLNQYDLNGSLATTDMEVVFLDYEGESELQVFPNPSSSLVVVKGDLVSLSTFQLLNMLGQDLRDEIPSYDQGDGSVVIDITDLANGVYTIKNGSRVISLVKE